VLQQRHYIQRKINPASLVCGVLTIGALSAGYASADLWGSFLTQQPPNVGIALCTVAFYGALCCALVTYAQLKQCTRECVSSDASELSQASLQVVPAYHAV